MAARTSPIIQAIQEYVNEWDAEHLLDVLPARRDLRWVRQRAIPSPASKALVIGSMKAAESSKIIAIVIQNGVKPVELRYYGRPAEGSNLISLLLDDLEDATLLFPFNHVFGTSKSNRRKFSILVKYFFIDAGLLTDDVAGPVSQDMCKRFFEIVREVEQGVREEHQVSQDTVVNEVDPAESPAPTAGPEPPVQSAQPSVSNDNAAGVHFHARAEHVSRHSAAESASASDFTTLKDYLHARGILFLLDNLPRADELNIESQSFLPDAQPKTILVGHHSDTKHAIFAYMRRARSAWHEIRFYADKFGEAPKQQIHADDLARHQIIHPFNKTYAKSTRNLDQSERARISLLVKWYFISSGVVRNVVLQETQNYPIRFRSALEYIARRMGSASVKPPQSKLPDKLRDQGGRSKAVVDESFIQSALSEEAMQETNDESSVHAPSTSSAHDRTRAIKRAADEVELGIDTDPKRKDEWLTTQINGIDHQIEVLELQQKSLMNKRLKYEGERIRNRAILRRHQVMQNSAPERSRDGSRYGISRLSD